ncbi:MarR family winged helix-turn-helix transcriptional regulator [Saprospira grandis]|uniref:Organic hydroperoxide resistance transcriptionalregulator n=1 Tax=Saprospira grandis (strain Lewin) TaxID=984262 RepID=H6L1A3_SAPGL|nr:MarR family transcriptional regulator [Saprospira grandis]AFC23444.1 organic hydroperoxide resistance transcriptionalregulator [Saprospira grandis str. Lewin]
MDKKIPLRLDQQFCFPVYAASRLIIRAYQPLLAPLGISYPQYLVFLLLWEEDGRSMKDLRERLLLNSNTITPLMKRMEKEGWLQRQKDPQDERVWRIHLTEKGQALKEEGQKVPTQLIAGLEKSELQLEDLQELKKGLELLIEQLS